MRNNDRSIITLITFFIFFLAAILVFSHHSIAQSFDHERYPRLDFDFDHLNLRLSLDPKDLRIAGTAAYDLTANISGADSIILYAAHMDIKSVEINGEPADFKLSSDSLIVTLSDSSTAGQQYELSIGYSSSPRFGILKNAEGTVWSSLLPAAQRHWLPVIDNPHVTFSTALEFTVPSGYSVWTTGRKTGEEVISVDEVRYTFSSNAEIPASSLSFAAGNFDHASTSFGIKRINVAVEKGRESDTGRQEILQSAYDFLNVAEDKLGLEYPFDRLNIILLDDHHWETKTWGASTVFLYRNRGDWQLQLQRGIIGQWFGVFHREEQWRQGDAISLYQAIGLSKLADVDALGIKQKDIPAIDFSTVYDIFGPEHWQNWQKGLNSWDNKNMKSVIANNITTVLREAGSVIGWDDYADIWYRKRGQPLFEVPEFTTKSTGEAESTDSLAYRINYTLNEADGKLVLSFEALHGFYKELTSLRTYEIYPDRTETSEVTFTGKRDSVVINVDPMINTFRIDASEHPELNLEQYKPASFLIYELRNAETVEERAEAAGKLGHHSDNPDLQLAIKDFMNRELEPDVRAALLHSFSEITQGASGTEQVFLDALRDENRSVQEAALMALQNYSQNEDIVNRVENYALNVEDLELFKKASRVYSGIAEVEQYRSFVNQTVKSDTAGFRAIYATRELANLGKPDIAVKQASLYLAPQFDYGVREAAMQILIQHDHTPADWLKRAGNLLSDSDPRIRFLTIQGLRKAKDNEIIEMLNTHIQDEYDARVHRALRELLSEEQ